MPSTTKGLVVKGYLTPSPDVISIFFLGLINIPYFNVKEPLVSPNPLKMYSLSSN